MYQIEKGKPMGNGEKSIVERWLGKPGDHLYEQAISEGLIGPDGALTESGKKELEADQRAAREAEEKRAAKQNGGASKEKPLLRNGLSVNLTLSSGAKVLRDQICAVLREINGAKPAHFRREGKNYRVVVEIPNSRGGGYRANLHRRP
ncbi:MAG: hypothetical protein AAB348_00440 [Patescibacteria group bacterium]